LKNTGHTYGTFRFTVHHQRGYYKQDPGPSSDFLEGTVEQTVLQTNFRGSHAITKLSNLVSTLFATIDPKAYAQYRKVYLKTMEDYIGIKNLDSGNPMQCFLGYYCILNLDTALHRDVMDPRNGWVAMVVFGNYEGGELYLPDLLIRLPYKDGDIVFLRSWALRHFFHAFKGMRYVIVFGTPGETMKSKDPNYKDDILYSLDDLLM
jgi:hypothetical protein